MRSILSRFGIALLITIACLGWSATSASAVEGESITLSPTSKHYELDPGASVSDTVTIINDGTTTYTFNTYARPYSVKDSDYEPVWDEVTSSTDAYAWVKFAQAKYTLKPGETVKVPYTIAVPKNAVSGGHYGVIFAETQPNASEPQSVVRQKRVGSIVYITVKGDNHAGGDLLATTIHWLQTTTPLSGTSQVKNTGNVDFADTTTMTVRDIFGHQKFILQRDLTVLPNTTRNMYYQWEDSGIFGLYRVEITHVFLGKTYTTSRFVLMMPLWLMAVTLLLVLGLLYQLYTKRMTKKAKPDAKKDA